MKHIDPHGCTALKQLRRCTSATQTIRKQIRLWDGVDAQIAASSDACSPQSSLLSWLFLQPGGVGVIVAGYSVALRATENMRIRLIAKDSFTGGVMAIIHYGKSVFVGNARTRRHRRRQSHNHLKCSMDNAFTTEQETLTLRNAERICQRQVISRVDRAVTSPGQRIIDQASFDNCCLPLVHLYAIR